MADKSRTDPMYGIPAEDRAFWSWRRENRPQPPAPGVGIRWQDRLKRNRLDE